MRHRRSVATARRLWMRHVVGHYPRVGVGGVLELVRIGDVAQGPDAGDAGLVVGVRLPGTQACTRLVATLCLSRRPSARLWMKWSPGGMAGSKERREGMARICLKS